MGAHFPKVSMDLAVSSLSVGISKITVLLAWELDFRELASDFGNFSSFPKFWKKEVFFRGHFWSVFSIFVQLGTWSRPRRRRGRRPHEMRDTLMLFALLVPSMYYHCLENLVVLWLWFESVRVMFSLFIILNALPVPMLRQVSGARVHARPHPSGWAC